MLCVYVFMKTSPICIANQMAHAGSKCLYDLYVIFERKRKHESTLFKEVGANFESFLQAFDHVACHISYLSCTKIPSRFEYNLDTIG